MRNILREREVTVSVHYNVLLGNRTRRILRKKWRRTLGGTGLRRGLEVMKKNCFVLSRVATLQKLAK